MNPEQLLSQLKRVTSALSTGQLATMAVVFVAVVGLVAGSAFWINTPTYALLYSDMDAEAASTIVTRLKNDNIPYQLDAGGRAVRVPAERVDELRLELASQGLPTSGRIGFEIFDRTQFGATEFLEHVNYRRALEGELARTIATIGQVQTARVHIAMAKESLFTRGAEPAKASVVLKLRNSTPLSASTIAGIAGLVSASVEALRPESVVIVDTFGRRLSGPSDERDDNNGLQMDRQHRMELDLTEKVIALLEPVVGVDRVRVNVAARLSADTQEETEEKFDPETVIRSRQVSSDSASSVVNAGVAGARGNAPPGASTATSETTPTTTQERAGGRSSETTNFEVSKVTRHRVAPAGQIARLSVAVIVDDDRETVTDAAGKTETKNKPRTAEDLQRIQQLVATSVGLDPNRGDQITVENIAFNELPIEPDVDQPWWRRAMPTGPAAGDAIRSVGVLVLALVALMFIVRPMMQRAFTQALPPAVTSASGALPKTVADIEHELQESLEAAAQNRGDGRLPALTKRLASVADQEPEQVARLMRTWLTEGDS